MTFKTQPKKILFLTGTRADYGKLKPLMAAVDADEEFECRVFVTGMHTLQRYGYTVEEVRRSGIKNIFVHVNQVIGESMDTVLANTIHGFASYVNDNPPDLIVVHGDRIEPMAGAIVGVMRNILTAHIEGGELSGTVDGLIRHAISKLAHTHFVANESAKKRLLQMGEAERTVYVIGSPDIDVMLSDSLPDLSDVKSRYEIADGDYAVAIFHPVTTEKKQNRHNAREFVSALRESGLAYVVVFPNNDEGTLEIMEEYENLKDLPGIRMLPSLRFEYFLTLLKNARFIIGNSSAGIREAPVYGIPSIDIGTRQKDRFKYPSIISAQYEKRAILEAIGRVQELPACPPSQHFGAGNSCELFMGAIKAPAFWRHEQQKSFVDLNG